MTRARELADLAGVSETALSNRNLIINGAMQVAQRGTSVTSISSGSSYHTCDRWNTQFGSAGTFTQSQSTTAPDGFTTSLKLDCTASDANPDYLLITHRIEGQNVQHLQKGTSSAKKTTLSFHVKSNKTGTYQVNLRDSDNSRLIGATYSISSANTWEKKIVTFAGDTSGVLANDNGNSLSLEWWLASGSTYNSGAVPTAWEAIANGDRAAGLNVAIGASTDDEFLITGIQLEIGEQATAFEHRSFSEELNYCKRYYEHSYPYGTSAGSANGGIGAYHIHAGRSRGNNYGLVTQRYTVEKRAAATVTMFGYDGTSGQVANGDTGANLGASTVIQNGTTSFLPKNASGAGFADVALLYHYSADAEL